ncbi:hypothetical protein VPNG_04885 [Cytospora leucostoma]|uniref:Infection structure specific protein n=1 Tax=Cytospora leucostoma TaxID=1230097 RepID=A0A423XBD3_9PEZI|nr:hypothetical protein VPNG_04885 [Cytospora leucostoma]
MYSQLVIAALATAASANLVVPGHIAIKYENHNVARATGTAASSGLSDAACETEVLSVAASLPTAAPEFESYALTQTQTDACAITIPASLSKDYSSYLTALESWYTKSGSSAIYSILSECPQYAAYTDSIGVCSTVVGAVTSGSSAAKTTGTASGSSATASSGSSAASSASSSSASAASSSSASSSGASAREVGIVGVVLAGVLGVAAAL